MKSYVSDSFVLFVLETTEQIFVQTLCFCSGADN